MNMRKIKICILTVCSFLIIITTPLYAASLVSPEMQTCDRDEECTLVRENCNTACPSIPVNLEHLVEVREKILKDCPAPYAVLPRCTVKPSPTGSCIDHRCVPKE